jgi:hypothetical protein
MRITATHTRTMRATGTGFYAGCPARLVGAASRSSLAS